MLNYLHDYHIFPHPDRGKGKGGEDVFRVLQPKLGFTNVVFFGIHLDWDLEIWDVMFWPEYQL